jgi:hypothetical protein
MNCDTGHFLVVAKVRERLAVGKQTTHTFHMERFNIKKLKRVRKFQIGLQLYRT